MELLGLWSVAVAQPVLGLVASSPEFFSERKTPAAAIVVFAVAIVLVVPGLYLLAEAMVEKARSGWGRVLHNIGRVVLLWAIALQLLNRLDVGAARYVGLDAPGWGLILVAALAALGILRLLRRSDGARMFLRFLAVAVPVTLLAFLTSVPLGAAPVSPALRVDRPVPIVMIVMDELPTTSLLKAPDRIDAERVPNFARLAREGTFYPNATTVADHTTVAVPAILSGQRGPQDTPPTDATNWPQNLFSLLHGSYRLDVREPITHLCPQEACPDAARSTPSAVGSLASEAPHLVFLSVAPNDLTIRSPLLNPSSRTDRVRVLSARSAYVETTLPEIRAGQRRVLQAQNRDVIDSELWERSCLLPRSGC